MEIENGYKFWIKIDELNPYNTLVELINEAGLNYGSVKTQRTKNRIPTAIAIYKLAKVLNTSMEYLLSGEISKTNTYSPEILRIADKLTRVSKLNLLSIENIVNTLPEETQLDSKVQIS